LDVQNKLAQAAGAAELAGLAADRMREEYASMIAEFKSSVSSELTEVKKVANQAGAREEAFKAKVEYADVRAPANGIVSAVYVTTIGAVVQGGTTLVEIVSDEQFVLVRAKLLAEDVSNVVVNQEANVSLSAYDVARFGSMKGRIQRIAQNTTIEENRPPFYETIIEIPDPKFSKSTEPVNMIPGMTVVVDIIGKKRSILNYILTPLERASGVVFREK
jgi:HlyD family type I secretion membrane fusion protein